MKIMISALVGALAVGTGAFGAHALKARLTPDMLSIWNTAAHYQLVHAVVLLAIALYAQATGREYPLPWFLLLAGVVLFSGSLYALSLSGIRGLGAVTPLGGVLLLAGWISIGVSLRSQI